MHLIKLFICDGKKSALLLCYGNWVLSNHGPGHLLEVITFVLVSFTNKLVPVVMNIP